MEVMNGAYFAVQGLKWRTVALVADVGGGGGWLGGSVDGGGGGGSGVSGGGAVGAVSTLLSAAICDA